MAYQKGHHVIRFLEDGRYLIAKIIKVDVNKYTLRCIACDDKAMIGSRKTLHIFDILGVWRYIPEKQLDSYLKLYS